MKKWLKAAFRAMGFEVMNMRTPGRGSFPADFTETEISLYLRVRPYTLTSPERVVSLMRAIEYINHHQIPGDLVECGVYKGGSMMAAALTLLRLGDQKRNIFLYDTYAGMTQPSQEDGAVNYEYWRQNQKDQVNAWSYASLEEVKRNLFATGFPPNRLHFIKGKVEETLPQQAPSQISLLRLDTDFYASTKHELKHLYPRVSPGGTLIIDDYGSYPGSRQATDEYLRENGLSLFLHRIDADARMATKSW